MVRSVGGLRAPSRVSGNRARKRNIDYSEPGRGLVRAWREPGASLVQAWRQPGTSLAPARCQPGVSFSPA
eukprot:15461032-Alexandrium_andersonii.AAC.1